MNLTIITTGLTLIIIGLLMSSLFADYLIVSGLSYIIYNLTKENTYNTSAIYGGKEMNIFSFAHTQSSGLEVDSNLLASILNLTAVYSDKNLVKNADVIIHIERITIDLSAKYHIWIPNQELISEWDEKNKNKMDLVLCKTHKTYDIMKQLYASTKSTNILYTGFTSMCDKKLAYSSSHKYDNSLVILPASSILKNVDMILEIWLANKCFMDNCKNSKLYIIYKGLFSTTHIFKIINNNIHNTIKKYCNADTYKSFLNSIKDNKIHIKNTNITIFNTLPDSEYKQLLHTAGIIICCSMNEGFGHYINESKYYGNIPLITDAAPMNELITQPELRVKATRRGTICDFDKRSYMRCADAYGVDSVDFAKKFTALYNSKNLSSIRKSLFESYIKNDKIVKSTYKTIFKNIKLHKTTMC